MRRLKELARIFFAFLIFCALLICSQDIQLFPWLLYQPFLPSAVDLQAIDPQLESAFVTTADGKQIDVWHLPAQGKFGTEKTAAIIFRGNGGYLRGFFFMQQFLSALGIESYLFDYRGYGRSTGWPSERGIYLDSEAVWDFVVKKEKVSAENIILVGLSIGTGPAAYLAQEKNVGVLVLLSPYLSIPTVVKERPVIGLLAPFLWYDFPTKEYVSRLTDTCLLVFHGKHDSLIGYHHGEEVAKAYHGKKLSSLTVSDSSDHNNLFSAVQDELRDKLSTCFSQ